MTICCADFSQHRPHSTRTLSMHQCLLDFLPRPEKDRISKHHSSTGTVTAAIVDCFIDRTRNYAQPIPESVISNPEVLSLLRSKTAGTKIRGIRNSNKYRSIMRRANAIGLGGNQPVSDERRRGPAAVRHATTTTATQISQTTTAQEPTILNTTIAAWGHYRHNQ